MIQIVYTPYQPHEYVIRCEGWKTVEEVYEMVCRDVTINATGFEMLIMEALQSEIDNATTQGEEFTKGMKLFNLRLKIKHRKHPLHDTNHPAWQHYAGMRRKHMLRALNKALK